MGSLEPPVGYLFADIEGSTERWEKVPAQMEVAVARLDSLIEEIVARNGGAIQDRSGDGVFALFGTGNPLQCALEMQLEMQRIDWSAVGGLDLRIGVHAARTGALDQVDRVMANRAARITASGWGGQIVVSHDASHLYEKPAGAQLIDLGFCRFKGVREAIHLASLAHPTLLRSEFPPLRSLMFDGADALVSPILGRHRELGNILARLNTARLLTIKGPGGIGKTRLALQVAAEVTSRLPVCFASLEGVGRDADLSSTLATALRLQLVTGRSAEDQLINYLRDKQMLLVLDNAETVAGRAALVAELVVACPQLTVVATSREPLGVEGEDVLRLYGLELLDAKGEISTASPALQFFLNEARRKDRNFVLESAQFDVFGRLCKKVEGSPLALRLVAEWTNLLSLDEILERLNHGVDFLSPKHLSHSGPSLRGVFEGSWRLLTPLQQRALACLSVFVKAFDAVAAANVAGADDVTFLALERKGLIVMVSHGRFAMHAMVREYAAERLAENAAEEAATRRRHSEYYLEAVCACMENVQSPSRAAAGEQLRQDVPEIRAAWLHAIACRAKTLLQTAIEPLCYFLYTRSMFHDALEIFGAEVESTALRRHILSIRANFLVHQGDSEGAAAAASRALAAPGGSQLARAHANQALGNLAHMRGDFKQANANYGRALSIREKVGDLRGCCYASVALGSLHLLFGHVDTAREHIKSGYLLARQVGDAFGMMVSHLYAGDLAAAERRLDDAQGNYEKGLRLEESVPHPQFRAMLYRRLGTLFALRGDIHSALERHQQAHDLSRDIGDQRTRAHALIEIGNDLRLLGDNHQAKASLLRGIRLSMMLGMQPSLRRGLIELAHADLALENIDAVHRTVRVLEHADLGDLRASYEALVAELEGGAPVNVAPATIQDLLTELIAEADVDTLKL